MGRGSQQRWLVQVGGSDSLGWIGWTRASPRAGQDRLRQADRQDSPRQVAGRSWQALAGYGSLVVGAGSTGNSQPGSSGHSLSIWGRLVQVGPRPRGFQWGSAAGHGTTGDRASRLGQATSGSRHSFIHLADALPQLHPPHEQQRPLS
jgi:hypothetical protein